MKYKIRQYAKLEGVKYRAIWNRIQKGQLQTERTASGGIRIIIDEAKEERVAIYCRVSSSENKANLDKQVDRLISYCNAKGWRVEKIIKEIGSGLNDKRKQLEKILIDPTITKIVVEHSDRFSRFGINYIMQLLQMQGRAIEIVNKQTNDRDDLMQDFVSIITSFCSRLYGLRRSKRKTEQLIKELEKENTIS